MKMNNLLVDVEIFSLFRKETLFQEINFDQTYLGGGFGTGGGCSGTDVICLSNHQDDKIHSNLRIIQFALEFVG